MIDPSDLSNNPVSSAANYLRMLTQTVDTKVVNYDATTATLAPTTRRLVFNLPRVGLASRIYVAFEANFTAVEAAAAGNPGLSGLAPWSAAQRLQVQIGGAASIIDLSGPGAHYLNECDNSIASMGFQAQPWPTPSAGFDVQHQVYAWDEATQAPKIIATARWGYILPFSLGIGNPLGMILLGTDRTTATLNITLDDLNAFVRGAANANPTATKVTLTVTVSYEYFEVPPESAYGAYVQPLLRYAHRVTEDRQDIVSVGPGRNVVQLLPFDAILQIIHYPVINGVLNVTAIDEARFKLNQSVIREQNVRPNLWRRQRELLNRDLPAVIFHFFEQDDLRAAIAARDYTDLRSEIDIATGTAIAAGDYIGTVVRKLVDLERAA